MPGARDERLFFLFAGIAVIGGRLHGVRALFGLAASLATVVFFVVPAIVHRCRSPPSAGSA